jgi:electron transfer flavoprotein beta subunit
VAATVRSRPLIVACLRHADLRPDVDPLTGAIQRDPRGAVLSAADAGALEQALRVADAWAGSVLAVSAGPPAADETLRQAIALGAEALRVPWPAAPVRAGEPLGTVREYVEDLAGDERALARAVAAAVRIAGAPDLVVCGDHSADRGTGALPAYLARELGAAQALGLVELHPSGGQLLAERRLDGGRRERLRVPRPAVCSVEGAGIRLRRASLPATLAAGRVAVPVADVVPTAAQRVAVIGVRPFRPRSRVVPPPVGTPRERLLALTGALVAHDPPTIVEPAGAVEAADVLLGYLRRHGYLLAEGTG